MATRRITRPTEDQSGDKRPVDKRRKDVRESRARTEVGKMAPKFEVLEELAKKFPPPQEWWGEDFDGL